MNESEWRSRYGVSGGTKLPLVTIIVINWNYGRYLRAALDSALGQDYPALEIVTLDNGSDDGSAEIMKTFSESHPEIRFIGLSENLGQLGAAHHIFAHHEVTGDFVCFLDSDDFLFPHFISHHVRAHLLVVPDAGVSTSDAFQLDGVGAVIAGSLSHWRKDLDESPPHWQPIEITLDGHPRRKISASAISNKATKWSWYPGTSNLFRSTWIHELFGLLSAPIPKKFCIDASAAPFCHMKAGTILLDTPLSVYRSHGSNVSSAAPRLQHFRAHRQSFIESDKEQAKWFKLQRTTARLVANPA
jgi:glycosyltransferase involved in cell wall biosynthesis